MRWCVIYNPDPDLDTTAVVAEDALEHYRPRGWRRVSDWASNADDLKASIERGDPVLSEDMADLDEPKPAAKKAATKTTDRESS